MKNLETISEELFNKIRGRHPSITIGDQEGKVTSEPKQARFFDFEYKTGDRKLGRVSVNLDEETLSVMYTNNFVKEEDDTIRQDWYDFLRELRNFAKKRLLDFDVRDITKSNLDRRDYKFLAQQKGGNIKMSESTMYGTNNISYQKIGNARLNIRHRKPVNTEQAGARTRSIDKIYIESPEGERFKYPYRHLAGARAMARHVSEGGNPYDDFGKHVVGLSEELNNLKKFKTYVGRSKVMAEGLSQYMDIIEGRAKDVKKELENIQKSNRYANILETYENIVLEEVPENIKTNWIDELTIRQFNEDLKDVFPYIFRLIKENTQVKEITPDDLKKELESEEFDEAVAKIACLECDEVSTAAAWKKNRNFCPKCETSNQGVAENKTHGNSKIYDKCWSGYRKVPGKKRGEKGSCKKIENSNDQKFKQLPITEFILSHYDKETGAWPRGETAVLTGVEKDYGEQFIKPAKQFIEKINQTYQQYLEGCDCEKDKDKDKDKKIAEKVISACDRKINEAIVDFVLKDSAHERELFWLQDWIGIEHSTLNQYLGKNRYALTFKNDSDAQKYAKELKDLGIAKANSIRYIEDPKTGIKETDSDGTTVEVAVRDALIANEIGKDLFRGDYENNGSTIFVFHREDRAEDFESELRKQGIQIVNTQDEEFERLKHLAGV